MSTEQFRLNYPPPGEQDAILLLIDTTPAALNEMLKLVGRFCNGPTGLFHSRVAWFVSNSLPSILREQLGDVAVTALRNAMYEMGFRVQPKHKKFYWEHVASYYAEKLKESQNVAPESAAVYDEEIFTDTEFDDPAVGDDEAA